jgi:hypothetical protein
VEDTVLRVAAPVGLNPELRKALERMARQRSLPARLVERARIVLLAADGLENRRRGKGAAFWRAASRPFGRMRRGRASRAPSPTTA